MKRLGWAASSVAFFAALLVVWKLAADAKLINPLWFPGPDRSFAKLGEWIATGSLWSPLAQTVWRVFAGWLLAGAVGITLGAAIASSRSLAGCCSRARSSCARCPPPPSCRPRS